MWAYLTPWLQSITVTGVAVALGFFYRDFLLKWLYRQVEHQFAERIEKFKSDLRVSEQEIQVRLAANQKQIETLYGTTLALSSGRQSAVDKRRLEAVERVWKSAVVLSKASGALKFLESLKFEEVLKAAPHELTKIGEMYSVLDKTVGASKLLEGKEQLMLLNEERPFVSESVWAYYSAFHALITHGVLVMSLLSKNMLDPKFFKFDAILDVIKKVLPHQAANIDKYGVTYCYMCASEILDALLRAVQDDLDGKHQDAAAATRVKGIMEAAHKAMASTDAVRNEASKTAPSKQ